MADQSEGIWRPYKDLLEIVERAVYRKRPESQHDLEVALKKFKPDFLALLKNPAKNPVHRDEIKKASTSGIYLHGQQEKQKLPEQFIQESLILSDILNLNEYVCTELLLAGEQQQPNFPGMTRGLVAVLLYHDGRRSLISALKVLMQSRDGITWTLGLNEELSQLITVYTNELLEEGLINTILKQLEELGIQSELEKLQKGQAIGDERHKRQLIDFITDQRQLLAECLFCAACQSTLSKGNCLQLISYLKRCPATEADGTLDSVTLTLLVAMLYCFNVEPLDEANEMQTSFSEDSLPLISDQSFIPDIHQELCSTDGWINQGLLATTQFAWSLVLRSCSQWPSLVNAVEVLEDDGAVFDMAVEGGVFGFLRSCVIGAVNFHYEDYFIRRLHSIVTGFIIKMPLKVKELRNHGDEACRILQACLQEGREPHVDIPRHFEDFLKLIGDLYNQDPSELHLAADYWCPPDPVATPFSQYRAPPLYNQRLSSKQVSLHKFVRLAGDLLPASLFIPYMEMLVGLSTSPQAAHHCFNMLKTTANSSITWDHFFTSIKQYYMDLRQDGGHSGLGFGSKEVSHGYRSHMGSRGITPVEQEALMAVLNVTQRIAEQDEMARITLCESQAWLPVASLFGLLSCPIDIRLKGCILNTLAAFAKSPEIAAPMWHTLELSQILVTVKQPGQTTQDRGIQVELNEIEARSETYPVTRAFLRLIRELIEIPIPVALGSGYRVPGFEPYLVYLRDDVFLKFNSRGYQNNKEKWQVSCGVLEVLFKLLDDYIPQAGDFVDQVLEAQGQRHFSPKEPGFTLMIHMLNDTPMLRLILSIIDNASSSLEQLQATSDGRSELERTALLCLRMTEVTLEKQSQFMDMLRSIPQATSVMLTSLDQLLMSINPQSQCADYLLKIARYLAISHIRPELSLTAIKILCQVCQSQAIQSHLVGLLTADKATSLQVLIGFVEHIEINEPEESLSKDLQEIGEDFLDEKSYGTSRLRNATRQNIVHLMLHSLDFPAPNLAHFLLGYELRRPVTKTNLQLPGVLGAPKTCLHAILQLINNGVETHRGPSSITETPRFTELAYKLIYHLCANSDTSMPTLRYLRTSHDFLYQHLQHLPFNKLVATEIEEGIVPSLSVMNQQSWLLKTAAIELKVTAQSRQRSHTQRLLALLLNEPSTLGTLGSSLMPDLSRTVNEDTTAMNASQSIYQSALYGTEPTTNPLQMRRKILSLLDSVEFTQEFPQVLQLNYFDQGVTERVIASCEQRSDETGIMYCNIRELHRLLNNEISSIQGTATAGQKNFLLQEVREILHHVVQRNMVRENLQGKKDSLESWRQVIEVILATCSYDILQLDTKQAVILETLQDLLMKIAEKTALTELTSPVSGVILTLMTHLRHSTLPGDGQGTSMSTIDTTTQGSHSLSIRGTSTPSGPLFAILRGIIEAVLRSGGGLQRVRANLYAAMLYFMQMAQKSQGSHGSKGVLEGVLSQPGESWEVGALSVLSSYGEPLMEVICRDACDGHDVGRMLAFSLLDSIVAIDWQKRWLNYFNLKGFLRNIIEGLTQEDDRLLAMLDPSPEPLKALYIYESKMALLTCIAQSQEGAEVLLQSGLMSRLAECKFLNRRPEYESRGSTSDGYSRDSYIPSVMERYRQLLLPALKVIGAVLTSLGRGHREAAIKVLGVVVAHSDVFISILQDRQPVHNSASLQELALVTSIICNAGLTETSFFESESLLEDEIRFRGPIARIQRLMMTLLPKYCSKDYWDKIIKSAVEQSLSGVQQETPSVKLSIAALETGVKLHQICSSIVAYCRSVVNAAGSSGPQYHVVFGPSLCDASSRESRVRRDSFRTPPVQSHRPPSLSILVNVVKDCVERAFKAVETHKQTSLKLENIHELTSEELKEVIQLQITVGPQEKVSTHQKQQLATKCLTQIISYKTQEIDTHLYIIENSLFILWRHLDFYFLHCIPSEEEHRILHRSRIAGRMRKLHEWSTAVNVSGVSSIDDHTTAFSDNVTRDEIDTLKQEASNCLTDQLLKKLVDLEQNHGKGRTHIGFIRVLVRRIKRLLSLHCSLANELIPGR